MTWQKPRAPFRITRHGEPIESITLKSSVRTGINFSPYYEQWDALVTAGATIADLYLYEQGEFPPWFLAKVVAWTRANRLINNNVEDAISAEMRRKSKK